MDVLKIESQTTGPMHWRLYGLRGELIVRDDRNRSICVLPNGNYILVLQEEPATIFESFFRRTEIPATNENSNPNDHETPFTPIVPAGGGQPECAQRYC